MELIDIVDEKNNLTGLRENRMIIHEKNLWHRHVSCWIMNEKGEVLLQKRAKSKKKNPNKWSKTGGHVNSNEKAEDAIIREIKEEIGIDIDKKKLELINIYKSKNENDRYFGYNYFIYVNYPVEQYTLQKSEVSKIKYMTIEKIEKIKKRNDDKYTFTKWDEDDFYKNIELLKEKRYKIIRNINELKSWKELYNKNIKKFSNMDDYINNNLKKKRIYLKQIKKYAFNKKIIECGCGTAKISTYFQNNGYDVTAVDIDDEIIGLSKDIILKSSYTESPKFYNMSIMNMNFQQNEFDVAFSNGVLEHFTNDEIIKIIKEECRIANYVVFGVPSKYFKEKEYMYGNERYLKRSEWIALIKKADAQLVDIKSFHSQSIKKRIRKGRLFKQKEFNLFIVKKGDIYGK